ncbi:HlyD family efflux transporter periplasmic adaptor subunit [Corallococcus sp. CA047B]|uniref:HlyD family secretion protein n=1 Tax=Corallococcus sp. CA047B TaxID=2316729 RepID=UPI000EA057B9|nr:HlyD family efflux transporter periplasmic adaptor subunit [Corallococcus sp. CA047B]RKH10157.1 HlyD family efflux transporter periplasmic adaptor subunit [Corallococcus sp. CA047B]
MSYDFRDSLASLDEGRRSTPVIATVLVFLVAWGAWLGLGRVSVYVSSTTSRLEVEGAAFPVEPTIAGRVSQSSLRLGQKVRAGEVLVRLESGEQESVLREQLARQAALESEAAALRKQRDAEREGLEGYLQLTKATLGEATAQEQQAAVVAEQARREASRTEGLLRSSYVSEAEYEAAVSEATRHAASSTVLRFSQERRSAELRVGQKDRLASIAALEIQLSRLTGEQQAVEASLPRLRAEVDKRIITAPTDGTIGSVMPLHPGMNLTAGQQLAMLVPERALQIIAYLPAPTALGRVRPGQEARLRLDGFPWTRFGAMEARVAQVAQEAQQGLIRVELSASPDSLRDVALEHGLSGSVEIEVEQLSPFALLFRGFAEALGTTS